MVFCQTQHRKHQALHLLAFKCLNLLYLSLRNAHTIKFHHRTTLGRSNCFINQFSIQNLIIPFKMTQHILVKLFSYVIL